MIINKNLEEEFNLTHLDPDEVEPESENTELEVAETVSLLQYKDLDKIERALPQVCGLDASDKEFDDLADYGIKAHKDLIELAFIVEQRFAGEVAGAAANMLGHALNARTNKIKKKLDMIALQLKKQLADHKTKEPGVLEELPGDSKLLDRNEILRHLLGK